MNATWVRRATAAAAVAAMVLVDTPRIATADPSAVTPASALADQRTFATIVVNGEQRGERIVFLRADGVYASLAGLRADGLVLPPRFDGSAVDRYANVKELAPEIVAVFDLNGPTLRLDAASAGSLANRSIVSLTQGTNPAGEALSARSGYLNYGLRAGSGGLTGAGELTLSDARKTVFSAGTFDAHGFHRSLSNVSWTNALARRTTTIGDVVGDSGDFGSAVTMVGASVARASAIDPDGQPYASPTLRGTVLTPSTADVYVNGQLIRSVDIAPGTVDFRNLPGAAGVTDATIVLRDAFGRTQTLSTRYYGAPTVLSKGATDYAFSAGASRPAFSGGSGGLVALGRYRLGLTQSTTVGAHAELAGGFENVGAVVDHAGRLGSWDVNFAESRDRGAKGSAAGFAYYAGTRNVWIDAGIRTATAAYTSLAERWFSDRTILDARVSLGLRPFRGSSTSALSYNVSRSLLGGAGRRLSYQQSVSLPGGVSLLVTAGATASNLGSQRDFSVSLFRSAPRSASVPTVNASLQTYGTALRQALELQHAPPPSGGTGYDVTAYASGPDRSSGRLTTRSPVGNVDVDYDLARRGGLTGNIALSGAVAFVGPYAHLSQPIADSFAMVHVAGGERVNVLLDNQNAGMTDRGGVLVIPNVPSYSVQRIRIERDDGPVNLGLSNADHRVVVASRHGSVAQFSASVVTAVIGTVGISGIGGALTPSFGRLSLQSAARNWASELDHDGRFYLEDVPAGRYDAVIQYGGGECRFAMVIPHLTAIEQNIGEFTCARS